MQQSMVVNETAPIAEWITSASTRKIRPQLDILLGPSEGEAWEAQANEANMLALQLWAFIG